MYTREEASRIRQEFWSVFGQYMRPVPSASGEKVNWINYNTKRRTLRFRLDASNQGVWARIEISGDEASRKNMFNVIRSLGEDLSTELTPSWIQDVTSDGKTISMVEWKNDQLNIFRKEDWPEMISFLKEKIIVLDRFWTLHKEVLETI